MKGERKFGQFANELTVFRVALLCPEMQRARRPGPYLCLGKLGETFLLVFHMLSATAGNGDSGFDLPGQKTMERLGMHGQDCGWELGGLKTWAIIAGPENHHNRASFVLLFLFKACPVVYFQCWLGQEILLRVQNLIHILFKVFPDWPTTCRQNCDHRNPNNSTSK